MVDFNQKIINTDKFRQAAIFFKKHGKYTLAPPGTTDYVNYWERETKRCLDGYTSEDGDYITGYFYFYLNYSPIMKLTQVEYTDHLGHRRIRRERTFDFPMFWNYDKSYYDAVQEAEEAGKHLAVLKSRAKGYSFKGASMLVRNYELIPGSKNFAVASEQAFLIGDGLLTKAWQIMDFLDQNTAWSKKRLTSTRLERVSGFKVTDEYGNQTEQGYLSSIKGITLKNDPERIRGTRGKLVLWEEGGKFPNLETAWRVEQPAVETDDGKAFGLLIAYGTGGTEGGSFQGLKNLFYKPDAYNCLGFPNIWDDNASDTKCGFFVPSYENMEGVDDNGNYCFMDKDGNTLKEAAIEELIRQRQIIRDGGASQASIDRFIAERPLKPQEAILELGKNIFPRKLLMDQLTKIRTNEKIKNMKHIVDLNWDSNGKVIATEKKSGDITEYPLPKDKKPEGSVVIWEYPIKDPPFGLYIGGCLTPGEKVCTQRGLVNVEDVTLDDRLINRDGKFVDIHNLQRYEKHNEDTFKIKPCGSFRTTNFTGEHPILTSNKGFIKAKDLSISDKLIIPNLYWNDDLEKYRYCKSNEQDRKLAYFYGLYIGDGFCNINKNSYDIYLFIGNKEVEFAKFYDNLVLELFGKKCIHVHKNKEQTRMFTDKSLLQQLSVLGTSAHNKRVPEWIKRGSAEIKLGFLQGYLDSDGSVIKYKNSIRVNYTSANLELLEDVQDVLYALEIKNSIVVHQKKCINKFGGISKQSYRINISQDDCKVIALDAVYNSRKIKLLNSSKQSKYSRINQKFVNNNIIIGIQSITKDKYTGIVYNFECDTHTFMCRNIMTHNCDPYDHDESFTNSLGSTFIFKRVKAGEAWNDVIVAEYSGRPSTAEDYYENVRKLLTMYNARLLFENERKGIYPYFTNKHCDYLLADQPDKVISEVFKDSKVQRRKGCHMTKQIRRYGEGLIKEWLEEEYEPGHPNLERIYSEPLLEELIMDDGVRNVDRVIALCMTMIYREELYQVKVAKSNEENKQVELFEMPLFSQQWWDKDEVQDDTPVFTF